MGGGDRPAVAVADRLSCGGGEGAVVAASHHHITDVDVAVGRGDRFAGERSGPEPGVLDVVVDEGGVFVGGGRDRQRPPLRLRLDPPVADRVQVLVEAARLDASAPPVLRQGSGVAAAEAE